MDVGSISLCIPVHNRTYDLKRTLPILLENITPSTEIVILDYNSPDDLAEYLEPYQDKITYKKYTGRNYYHMAHARNLSVLASRGDFVSIFSADIYISSDYISTITKYINEGYVWMYGKYPGLLTIKKDEFINAGGYDERFEFYGPEDKDLNHRLRRRGLIPHWIPSGVLFYNNTPDSEKVKNYRLELSKKEMGDMMWEVFLENEANQPLVANPNGWGSWE